MLYSLPTGRVVELSIEQYLAMTDEDFDQLAMSNNGFEVNDPFYKSVIHQSPFEGLDEVDFEMLEEYTPDLTEITDEEKLLDPEFHHEDE